MTLRDLLKRKDGTKKPEETSPGTAPSTTNTTTAPLMSEEFTFIRTDTHSQELISPPTFPDDREGKSEAAAAAAAGVKRSHNPFRRSSSASNVSTSSSKPSGAASSGGGGVGGGGERRLSERLHLRAHSRSPRRSSVHVPSDLPSIDSSADATTDKSAQEAQWEKRATLLARGSSGLAKQSPPATPGEAVAGGTGLGVAEGVGRPRRGSVSDPAGDETVQEAIRLHEAGDLERSTAMFGRLADPSGGNNALSQVLYGLALRHGWGCPPDPPRALHYLSLAAQNSAAIEALALETSTGGGAAKGELVLAIYELGNCFRHGWGVPKKDPVAAKHYYETAANLGDVDAMNEVGWCYETGFGTPKDKAQAARYYRLAERNGNKTLGNSWIWKDKYND